MQGSPRQGLRTLRTHLDRGTELSGETLSGLHTFGGSYAYRNAGAPNAVFWAVSCAVKDGTQWRKD